MDRTHPTAELSSIKVVGSEAGERNSFCAEDEEVETLMKATDISSRPAKIQKVIFLLRDHKEFQKYFEPRVASLGPIHHGNPKYDLGQKYKLRLAHEYVKNCDKNVVISPLQINKLYQRIMENIGLLRESFEKEVTEKHNDKKLAWMLLVDGCAILQYIFTVVEDKFSELNIKNDSVTFAYQDLFLLENQVPYRLLKLLMSLSEKKAELERSIEAFIQSETMSQMGEKQKTPAKICWHGMWVKLLECARRAVLRRQAMASELKEDPSKSEEEPTHLLDLLRTRLLGDKKSNKPWEKNSKKKREYSEYSYSQSFRNLQELKEAGIHVRCGKSSNLKDVSFTRGCCCLRGYLWLPEIKVDDSTGPKFMNLIAYEMCLDFHNDFGITSYISFLDSLIDERNDVKQLRKAGVLHNFLGSDEQVADLFNEIGTDLVPNIEAYTDVKCQIQDHYNNICMTWIAQLLHKYFSTPWSVLAFFGALLALGLSAIQTWCGFKKCET